MLVWFARLILLLVAEKLLGPALKQESMLLKLESVHSKFEKESGVRGKGSACQPADDFRATDMLVFSPSIKVQNTKIAICLIK